MFPLSIGLIHIFLRSVILSQKKSISATCQIQNRVGLVVMCIFRVNCLKVGPNEPFKLWELRLYFSDHNETSLRKAIMAAAAPLISQMGLIQTRNHHGT